jgi:hypothetical protein
MSVYTDFIRKLTDVFTKKDDSNVAKLVSLLSEQIDLLNDDFTKIEEWKSIDLAEGKTLDLIGENYGQSRGQATDEIMRVLIKARIARNSSDGTFDSIIHALAKSINADPSKIKIRGLASDITLPTWSNDFTGKVAGSTVENPHKFQWGKSTTLVNPTTLNQEETTKYENVKTLNGSISAVVTGFNTEIAQQLFSFNLIAAVEKKVGGSIGATTADKVAWLKANLSKITANWHGYGSNKLSNPTGSADFVNKVAGSTVENPHLSGRTNGGTPFKTTLVTPNEVLTEMTGIEKLDGSITSIANSNNGAISQHRFSFNLIEYVQRKYSITIPGADTAAKVAWLKANVSKLTANWYGFGSSPTGNKATLKMWNQAGSVWSSTNYTHSNGTVTKLSYPHSDNVTSIGSDGFIHFLAYADPSNGTTASTINTDYISLDVEMVAGANKASLRSWHGVNNAWTNQFGTDSTSATVAKNVQIISSDAAKSAMIQSDGFVHFLAYAEPSNGLAPSIINTDYINLELTLKPYNLNPEPASIAIEGVPLTELNKVGMNATQFGYIAQKIVAAGIKVKSVEIKGTFSFSSANGIVETDSGAGFAPLDQSTGGSLGATFEPDETLDLPI